MYRNYRNGMLDNLAQKQDRLHIRFNVLLLANKLIQNLVAQNKHLLPHSSFILRIWAQFRWRLWHKVFYAVSVKPLVRALILSEGSTRVTEQDIVPNSLTWLLAANDSWTCGLSLDGLSVLTAWQLVIRERDREREHPRWKPGLL